MEQVSIQIQGLDEMRAKLAAYPSISKPIFAAAINKALSAIEAEATDDTFQFKTARAQRTGMLALSFRFGRRVATPENLVGAVGPTVEYAKWVEGGTKAHMIEARNKRALANTKTGQIFGRRVMHPGSAANPFMERIAEKATPKVNEIMAAGLEAVTNALAT